MPLSHDDVRRILDILANAGHVESLDIQVGDFLVQARKPGAATPLQALHASAAAADGLSARSQSIPSAPTEAAIPEGMIAVRASMAGTFFIKPKPDEPPYVEEGSVVAEGSTVCLLEVMKMFNSVSSPVNGTVRRILAPHGKPVQHDQILMLIEPSNT
jgi:acetyl-CoA carboxylase biotin carboxyl carrier protein